MRPQWQQQMQQRQQQMQQQQQQQQRMAAGYWWQKKQQQAQARQPLPDDLSQNKDEFTQVETKVTKLRQDVAAGRLTETQFKDRLKELMVQDKQGSWWMVGAESGEWYRHDGLNWVRAVPPKRTAPQTAPKPSSRSGISTKHKPRRFLAAITFLFLLALTIVFGIVAANISDVADFPSPIICASVVWLIGLSVTINITRKVQRGK